VVTGAFDALKPVAFFARILRSDDGCRDCAATARSPMITTALIPGRTSRFTGCSRARLQLPVDDVAESVEHRMHDTGQSAPGRLTRGCRVRTPITTGPRMILRDRNLPFAPSLSLLAEDEGAISIALEDALADDGYTVAGPFSTCARAQAWLVENTPELALLDVWLSDGSCFELARALRARDVPVFVSAAQSDGLPKDLEGVPWLEKPFASEDLMEALRSALGWQSPG
jgi:CheY-like chemotaxis protein